MHALWYAAAVPLLLTIVACGAFVRWRSLANRRLRAGSTLVNTGRGPIDCAFAGAECAPPALVLHGGLGGWDQAIALAEDLGLTRRCHVVAPSRPGYLRTPLHVGRTTDAAADSMIALLDSLGIASALVVGVSGGGPTALAMARRHGHRVRALAMVCAISHRHEQPAISTNTLMGRILFSNAGAWLMDVFCWLALLLTRVSPAFMASRILEMTELADRRTIRRRVRELRRHPERLRWVSRLLEHSFPISPRKSGLDNDLVQFSSLSDRVVEPITVPTLVVHGRIDGNVPIEHAQAVIGAARRVETLIIDDASHLLWLHPRADQIRDRVNAFLEAMPASP